MPVSQEARDSFVEFLAASQGPNSASALDRLRAYLDAQLSAAAASGGGGGGGGRGGGGGGGGGGFGGGGRGSGGDGDGDGGVDAGFVHPDLLSAALEASGRVGDFVLASRVLLKWDDLCWVRRCERACVSFCVRARLCVCVRTRW